MGPVIAVSKILLTRYCPLWASFVAYIHVSDISINNCQRHTDEFRVGRTATGRSYRQPRCPRKPLRPVALRPCLSASVPLSYEATSLHGAQDRSTNPFCRDTYCQMRLQVWDHQFTFCQRMRASTGLPARICLTTAATCSTTSRDRAAQLCRCKAWKYRFQSGSAIALGRVISPNRLMS
jgi:hypothetical protein